jgi:hypothetical protein
VARSKANYLLHRAIGLANRVAMIAGAGEIRIRKRDTAVRAIPENVPRRRLAVNAEKESCVFLSYDSSSRGRASGSSDLFRGGR